MAYCHINYIRQNSNFNSSTSLYESRYNTFLNTGETLNLIAQKTKQNNADIIIVANNQEYNLNNTVSFNETISFYIKVIFNGATESFDVNIINSDCGTIFYPLSFNYEV